MAEAAVEQEIEDRGGDLVGAGEAGHRMQRDELLAHEIGGAECLGETVEHRGLDAAGADRVHADFFLAFLPQFVEPGAISPLLQLLGLSAVFMLMTFVVFVAYGMLAHAFRRAVIDSPRVQAWLRRGFAAAFAGLGTQLALSER